MIEASELMPDLDINRVLRETPTFNPLTKLAEAEERYPQAMEILRAGGVHPTEFYLLRNPYFTDQEVVDDEFFGNAGESCIALANCGKILAEELLQRGVLTAAEIDTIVERGLTDDANKRYELMRRKAQRAGVAIEVYSVAAYKNLEPVLRQRGIRDDLISRIAVAGVETGHTSLAGFLHLEDGNPTLVPGRMIDKIVHLADDMTHTPIFTRDNRQPTWFLTPWERMVASDFPNRYSFMWKEGLAFTPDGKVIEVRDFQNIEPNLRCPQIYAYWQVFVSNLICQEFKDIIATDNTEKPELFIKNLVNSKLTASA